MIEETLLAERKKVLNELSFYDFQSFSLSSGYEKVLKLSEGDNNIRYCDVSYNNYDNAIKNKYYKREKLLIKIFSKMIPVTCDTFLLNYSDNWIVNKRIAPQLSKLLNTYDIRNKSRMLKISMFSEAIAFLKSILRYNSFASFLFPAEGLVIFPTDHMDIFIFSKNYKTLNDVSNKIVGLGGYSLVNN